MNNSVRDLNGWTNSFVTIWIVGFIVGSSDHGLNMGLVSGIWIVDTKFLTTVESEIRIHLKSGLFEDWNSISKALPMAIALVPTIWKLDHSQSVDFWPDLKQVFFYKMAAICLDFKWLGFLISDPRPYATQPLFDHLKSRFQIPMFSDARFSNGYSTMCHWLEELIATFMRDRKMVDVVYVFMIKKINFNFLRLYWKKMKCLKDYRSV